MPESNPHRSLGQFIGQQIDQVIGVGRQGLDTARKTVDQQRHRASEELQDLEQEALRLSGQARERLRDALRRLGIDLDLMKQAAVARRGRDSGSTGLRQHPTPDAKHRSIRPTRPHVTSGLGE